MTQMERRHAALCAFLDAAETGDQNAYISSIEAINHNNAWVEAFRAVVLFGKVHNNTRTIFAKQWFGDPTMFPNNTPCATNLRSIFFENTELLVDGLRMLLPPFDGHVPPVIFRGQSISEYENGVVGFSWTPHPLLAELYARDPYLNKDPCLVLAHFDPGNWIIGKIDETEILMDPRIFCEAQVILRPGKLKAPVSLEKNLSELHLQGLQKFALDAMPSYNDKVGLSLAAGTGIP